MQVGDGRRRHRIGPLSAAVTIVITRIHRCFLSTTDDPAQSEPGQAKYDKKAGMKTTAVVLGKKKSLKLITIGFSILLLFLLAYLLIADLTGKTSAVLGILVTAYFLIDLLNGGDLVVSKWGLESIISVLDYISLGFTFYLALKIAGLF